jgi:hypothetical protein
MWPAVLANFWGEGSWFLDGLSLPSPFTFYVSIDQPSLYISVFLELVLKFPPMFFYPSARYLL